MRKTTKRLLLIAISILIALAFLAGAFRGDYKNAKKEEAEQAVRKADEEFYYAYRSYHFAVYEWSLKRKEFLELMKEYNKSREQLDQLDDVFLTNRTEALRLIAELSAILDKEEKTSDEMVRKLGDSSVLILELYTKSLRLSGVKKKIALSFAIRTREANYSAAELADSLMEMIRLERELIKIYGYTAKFGKVPSPSTEASQLIENVTKNNRDKEKNNSEIDKLDSLSVKKHNEVLDEWARLKPLLKLDLKPIPQKNPFRSFAPEEEPFPQGEEAVE